MPTEFSSYRTLRMRAHARPLFDRLLCYLVE